jgi:hypothetical protein
MISDIGVADGFDEEVSSGNEERVLMMRLNES